MKVLREGYTPQEIMDRAEDVQSAYLKLREAIYVFGTSVEEIETLGRDAHIAAVELEELWKTTLNDIIEDTKDYFAPKEEEEE